MSADPLADRCQSCHGCPDGPARVAYNEDE